MRGSWEILEEFFKGNDKKEEWKKWMLDYG
jgi:hypothetical protein